MKQFKIEEQTIENLGAKGIDNFQIKLNAAKKSNLMKDKNIFTSFKAKRNLNILKADNS